MLTALLITAIVVLIAGAGAGLREVRTLNAKLDNYDRAFSAFFTPDSSNQMSPFTSVVDQIATLVAERQAIVTQASIRGALGANQKVLNRELEQVAIQEDPSLALASVLPASLKKNPTALMGLQYLLSRMKGGGPGAAPINGAGGQARFTL